MHVDELSPNDRAALVSAAKNLETVAYSLAGEIDPALVSQLIIISAEVSRIEQKIGNTHTQ